MLGSSAGLLVVLSSPLMSACQRVLTRGLSFDATVLADPLQMTARLGELSVATLLALAPLLLVMLVAAVAGPLMIGGFIFSGSLAAPKFSRIDPLQGFTRMLSGSALVELAKVLIVAVLLAAVGGWYVHSRLGEFAGLALEALPAGLSHLGWMIAGAFALLVATLALTSAIDVPYQIFQHHSKLKMSLQEVKQEAKESEGDPHIKGRIRQQQRDLARKRMMAAVPKADVVVTNPTHFAVALKYLEGRHRAPVVVAKGTDEVAAKIRELAREAGVPQLEAPPLARALYKHAELGEEIPAALYGAVAQVLAWVFQLRAFTPGRGPWPSAPQHIDVPEGMDPQAPRATA